MHNEGQTKHMPILVEDLPLYVLISCCDDSAHTVLILASKPCASTTL